RPRLRWEQGSTRPATVSSRHSPLLGVEQAGLRRLWLRQAEMDPARAVQAATARGAGDQAQLDKVGLDHFLDRVARLAQAGGQRLDADRPALVDIGDHRQVATV